MTQKSNRSESIPYECRILRSAAWPLYLAGGLCLLGGLASVAARIRNGTWPEVLGQHLNEPAAAILTAVLIAFGITAILLPRQIRKLRIIPAVVFLALAWLAFLITAVLTLRFGRGLYELGFFLFLVLDAHVTLACISRLRQRGYTTCPPEAP